jgi:GDP-L-fucose synthase
MKSVLVTGHSGFLGRHLVKGIERRYPNVKLYFSNSSERNLLRPIDNEGIDHELDYIFHLAVDTKAGDYCLHHQADQWENNQLINTNIMHFWRRCQPQAKMVTMGTSCAYPDDEQDKLEAFAQQDNMKYIYFIPNTLYGPDFEITDKHFIFEVIAKIAAAKYEGKTATLWGSGYQKRELIYIDDAVNGILNNLHLENERVNIATGKERTIRDYVERVCECLSYPTHFLRYDVDAYEGQKSKELRPSPLTGPFNQTDLDQGIKKTVDYYVKQKYGNKM